MEEGEEFQESDILWPTDHHCDDVDGWNDVDNNNDRHYKVHGAHRRSSNPITVPAKLRNSRPRTSGIVANGAESKVDDDDGGPDGGGGEMVPPHVMLAERITDSHVCFSVYVGNGRTLKGRDLRRFRNSILRMTGFLET